MSGEPSGGLLVMPDSFTMSHQGTIVASAARHRVPAIYAQRLRQLLRGTKAADLYEPSALSTRV